MDVSTSLITSVPKLKDFLLSIRHGTSLYLDLEGSNLGRHGSISLITVLVHPGNQARLIDIQALGSAAFTTPSTDGTTLKSILENPKIPKYLWDLRSDADALWSLFNVRLAGVTDIQLLENASRGSRDNTFLSGLASAIRLDLPIGSAERERWLRTKDEIKTRMSAGVFSARPLDAKTILYCLNDVNYLPALHAVYERRISPLWLAKAKDHSQRRAVEACSPSYDHSQSPNKARGPWAGLKPTAKGDGAWLAEQAEAMYDLQQDDDSVDRMCEIAEEMYDLQQDDDSADRLYEIAEEMYDLQQDDDSADRMCEIAEEMYDLQQDDDSADRLYEIAEEMYDLQQDDDSADRLYEIAEEMYDLQQDDDSADRLCEELEEWHDLEREGGLEDGSSD